MKWTITNTDDGWFAIYEESEHGVQMIAKFLTKHDAIDYKRYMESRWNNYE
jgi:hypothetical protein